MVSNSNSWFSKVALVAFILFSQTHALPDLDLEKDYQAVPIGNKPWSFSSHISIGAWNLENDELAAVAKEASSQIHSKLGMLPKVVSVLQDQTTQEIFIASNANHDGRAMYPANDYLVNRRIALLPGGVHKNDGGCAECNVLRLFEDIKGRGQAPSQGSKIVAYDRETAIVWNPCQGNGNGCAGLISQYQGLVVVGRDTVTSMEWPEEFVPEALDNPRRNNGIICQRDVGSQSCGMSGLNDPAPANDTMESTTMSATSLQTLTTSLTSLSLTSTGINTASITGSTIASVTASVTVSTSSFSATTSLTIIRSSSGITTLLTSSSSTTKGASFSTSTSTSSVSNPTTLITKTSTPSTPVVTTLKTSVSPVKTTAKTTTTKPVTTKKATTTRKAGRPVKGM